MLEYSQIRELIKDIDNSSLREFQLECSDIKLKLSKNNNNYDDNEKGNNLDIDNSTVITANKIEEVNIEQIKEYEGYNIVKSPLVGTYYSSSTPGGSPFVKVGEKVKKGDTLCIIEAMKIMNEITSEFDGEVVEVLRSDEEIVEFGMELFKIK